MYTECSQFYFPDAPKSRAHDSCVGFQVEGGRLKCHRYWPDKGQTVGRAEGRAGCMAFLCRLAAAASSTVPRRPGSRQSQWRCALYSQVTFGPFEITGLVETATMTHIIREFKLVDTATQTVELRRTLRLLGSSSAPPHAAHAFFSSQRRGIRHLQYIAWPGTTSRVCTRCSVALRIGSERRIREGRGTASRSAIAWLTHTTPLRPRPRRAVDGHRPLDAARGGLPSPQPRHAAAGALLRRRGTHRHLHCSGPVRP